MRRWTDFRGLKARLAAARRRSTPEDQAERADRIATTWAPALTLLAEMEAAACQHEEMRADLTWSPDGSRDATCAGCGMDGFPIVDVAYELWSIVEPWTGRYGGTARQRRIQQQRRLQRARKHAAMRREEYVQHIEAEHCRFAHDELVKIVMSLPAEESEP